VPELPDVTVYLECLEDKVLGRKLEAIRVASPFLLRTVEPKLAEFSGKRLERLSRLGKRLVFGFEGELYLVLHLMIAGRLKWSSERAAKLIGRIGLAAFDFESGTLQLTEAGTKRRASLHAVRGREGLAAHDRGGLEVLGADPAAFKAALTASNHTLKRALADPTKLSGIGNAYSDEILHKARLSPLKQTQKLDDEEHARLYDATQATLQFWIARLREEAKATDGWPEKVTAFREGMAVHGRYKQPCPDCGGPVQRIAYAENETNYCPRCQNEGRMLADRSLSRLLKDDWPKSIDELEAGARRS
jgi:formamidopyrimidine-DNA glycosylase